MATEDETVVWHHRLNGHKFEPTLRENEAQGSLACYSPWGQEEQGVTLWHNIRNLICLLDSITSFFCDAFFTFFYPNVSNFQNIKLTSYFWLS